MYIFVAYFIQIFVLLNHNTVETLSQKYSKNVLVKNIETKFLFALVLYMKAVFVTFIYFAQGKNF